MSHELIYTSAPKGLHAGSQGFCTVACTKGIPAALMEKLESLSGYRPLYPPHDPKAALNPVSFGHTPIQVAGRTYHVLSRVCFSGVDYTDRTNKFAHHVALEPHELPLAGPAWVLRQPGFMETRWDGQVRHLPAGRMPPSADSQPAVCREWERQVGDAGWAGVIIDTFLKNPDRPVYFLYEPGADLLPMLAEALALLPAEQRWRVSFNTYVSGPASCPWRGLPRSSEEAAQVRRSPAALVVPLGERLPAPSAGPFVDAARAGRAVAPASAPAAVSQARAAPIGKPVGGIREAARPSAPPPAAAITTPAGATGAPIAPGRRGAGFGLGLAVGLLASMASLAGLVMAGVVLIPTLFPGDLPAPPVPPPARAETPIVSTSAGNATAAEVIAELADARRQIQDLERKVANAQTATKETRDKAAQEWTKLEQEIEKIRNAHADAANLKKDLSKSQADYANLEKARRELEDELIKLRQTRPVASGPPLRNVIHYQFDVVKESLEFPFKEESMDVTGWRNEELIESKAKTMFRLTKQLTKDHQIRFMMEYEIFKPFMRSGAVPIARLGVNKGKLSLHLEKAGEKKEVFVQELVDEARDHLLKKLPNHFVVHNGKTFIGLRRSVKRPAKPISRITLQNEIANLVPPGGEVLLAGLSATQDAKGEIIFEPHPGAKVYQIVYPQENKEKWHLELITFE